MKRHKLFIVLVILGFSIGLFSLSPKAKTVSGTARNMIVEIMDSKGNILNGIASAIGGVSYPNEIVQVMNSNGQILDSLGGSAVTGQVTVNAGLGTLSPTADGAMIAGPVGAAISNNVATTISAPSFTTDVSNAVVFNVFGTDTAWSTTPAADTQLVNIAALGSNNDGLWAGYQTVSSGASGAQAMTFSAAAGAGAVTIPFMPVPGTTIGISTSAGSLQTAVAAGANTITVNVPTRTKIGDTLLACESWYPNANPVTAYPPQQPVPATGTQRWVNDGAWYGTTAASSNNGGIQCWHHLVSQTEPASYSFPTTSTGTGVPAGFIADLTNVLNLDVPMTSATGTFTAANVGNDLCLQGANGSFLYNVQNSTGGQSCGQIGVFSSATKIYPTFGNLSGATLSGKQYAYGPDQNLNGLLPANGGTLTLGTGIFMTCGGNNTSTCLTFPNGGTIIQGQGRAASNWGYPGGGPFGSGQALNNTNLGTYIIVANTDLNQPAWVWNIGTNSILGTVLTLSIRDLTLWGGVGVKGDGGGTVSAIPPTGEEGLLATNFQWLDIERTIIGNFAGHIVHTQAVGSTSYTDGTYFLMSWFTLSGAGDGWKSDGGPNLAQNEMTLETEIDNNANSGVELTGAHDQLSFMGDNIQRNDNFDQGGSRYQIYCNGCTAWGVVQGNYFENDSANQNAAISNAVSGWAGEQWLGNFGINVGGGAYFFNPTFAGSAGDALPSATAYGNNQFGQCVTDAAACTNGSTYAAAGGAIRCRVQSNGTNWLETGMGC